MSVVEDPKFEILSWEEPPYEYTDYTDNVDFASLEIGARCDEAFASGSCRLMCDRATNIPPYTLAYILGKHYLIQSEVTKYQTQQYLWVHNVSIIEISALLECFILGSKAFTSLKADNTKTNDRTKVARILSLINNKILNTPFEFKYDNADLADLANQYNDYTFGAGTTLYGALTEIFKKINARPVVEISSYDNENNKYHIYVKPFKLDGDVVFNLPVNFITQETTTQSQADYCKYLETEAHNVVDRTNTHKDTNLTLRSPIGQRFIWDNTLRLYTSAKIDYVEHLWATGIMKQFVITRMAGRDFLGSWYSPTLSGTTWNYSRIGQFYSRTFSTIIDQIPDATTKANFISGLHTYCSIYGIDYDKLIQAVVYFDNFGNETTYTYEEDGITYTDKFFVLVTLNFGASSITSIETKINLTNYILEKSQYDAETTYKQPKYAYYTQGSNEIGGLYNIIDTTFWENIFHGLSGAAQGPMLDVASADWNRRAYNTRVVTITATTSNQQYHIGDIWTDDNQITPATLGPYYSYTDGENTVAARFEVQYAAITNPRMIDAKTDTPANESSYKPMTRSYNNSAALIDFDKLVPSMTTINAWLGVSEKTIEFDATSFATLPELTNKINGMYLMSYTIKYYMSHVLMTLNLAKSYSKVAEAIGVAYQYRATNFAVDEIIERPIYYKPMTTIPSSVYTAIANGTLWLNIAIGSASGPFILTKPVIMKKDGKIIIYAEAMDQYAWGIKKSTYTGNGMSYEISEYVAYGDSNNEGNMCYIWLVSIDNLTNEQSDMLPKSYLGYPSSYLALWQFYIYKDQREKLTFTFEIEEEE